uniref:adenylate cyclase n=1 Tax=Parastrongyloides trichosuri TaxID=131310 RepID=A0A0N4ZNA6_PARTI
MLRPTTSKKLENGEEVVGMLSHENVYVGGGEKNPHSTTAPLRSTSSPHNSPLFERASARWWNPQFDSTILETEYWNCSFPLLRKRFRLGLIYILLTSSMWMTYLRIFLQDTFIHWSVFITHLIICTGLIIFSKYSIHYQRFYMPTSFLCIFLIFITTQLIFSQQASPIMGPVAMLTTSIQVVLLVYTVIPLPLYVSIIFTLIYSILYEILTRQHIYLIEGDIPPGVRMLLHICIHLLGIHLYILTQVRQRITFLTVAISLMAKNDLKQETTFKNAMIASVMPEKYATEICKDANELRRPSQSEHSAYRMSNATTVRSSGDENAPLTSPPSVGQAPDVRKFRPFTMNLMTDVSILFADIAGFTKMSSNKSAEELVNLLNDLFGRFDNLCRTCKCEKISTLGDCYYCVSGCPEPQPDHAKWVVEMGLAMIVAIRQFDIDRGQEVNMRVGIHTGKVMCGMVGTKRFKFDVFSNDVTLANEMESTGIAGRVHISEVTAKFLNNQYILEDGPSHHGMKTYFIAGRTKECEEEWLNYWKQFNTPPQQIQEHNNYGAATKGAIETGNSFRRKIVTKLKSVQSVASSRASPNSFTATGSFRNNLKKHQQPRKLMTASNLNVTNDDDIELSESKRKSSSLMALAKTSFSSSIPEKTNNLQEIEDDETLIIAKRIGGKISIDLANDNSICNSLRGSQSSGLQNLSECASMNALDTAISLHNNATSLTRGGTDDREYDQKLAKAIQSDADFVRNFWKHEDSLNRWTLTFKDKDIEKEYRTHFGDGIYKQNNNNNEEYEDDILPVGSRKKIKSRKLSYNGVLVDLAVCGIIYFVVLLILLVTLDSYNIPFIIYSIFGSILLIITISLLSMPVLSKKAILPIIHQWIPRHIIGLTLIAMPLGLVLSIIPLCKETSSPDLLCIPTSSITVRLIFSLLLLIIIYAHANFSQLGCWPKTIQAIVIALIFLGATGYCQSNLNNIMLRDYTVKTMNAFNVLPFHLKDNCNGTQPLWAQEKFGSPLFIWELVVVVILSVILVGFSNYQFEAAGRISFYGDVVSRKDTRKMVVVRDQADWLLTNIIPPHALKRLNKDQKYSKNRESVAVMFATITNWNEMYEENFEGGREFIRVLNEIIGDFDDLLDRPEFAHVEKIKTIGSTYMAASGLNTDRRNLSLNPYEHLYQLMEFALALQNVLNEFNEDLLNFDFVIKIGINIGPVTAGVIGTTKLYYDIWGDTVNIASRMYSTGVDNRIQVSQYTKDLLCDRYEFEFRDHIEVKGVDGGMDTYLLTGRKGEPPLYPKKNN